MESQKITSEQLRNMIIADFIRALYHKDEIIDTEMFIADFSEIVDSYVKSKNDLKN